MKKIRIGSAAIGSVFGVARLEERPKFADADAKFSDIPVYLDLKTGDVVVGKNLNPDEMGDGRPAVAAGKRFVRIPPLAELVQQMEAPLIEKVDAGTNFDSRVDYACALVTSNLAAIEQAVLRWLKSLRLPTRIEYFDGLDGGPTLYIYDPQKGEWVDTEEGREHRQGLNLLMGFGRTRRPGQPRKDAHG